MLWCCERELLSLRRPYKTYTPQLQLVNLKPLVYRLAGGAPQGRGRAGRVVVPARRQPQARRGVSGVAHPRRAVRGHRGGGGPHARW